MLTGIIIGSADSIHAGRSPVGAEDSLLWNYPCSEVNQSFILDPSSAAKQFVQE